MFGIFVLMFAYVFIVGELLLLPNWHLSGNVMVACTSLDHLFQVQSYYLATATRETKEAILEVLGMKDPYKIEESPEKPNVSYVVGYMQHDKSLCHQFEWLVAEINKNGLSTERTIIYCQTIQQCSHIYSTLKSIIGDTIYAGKLGDNRNVLLEMLHSCSPPSNKEVILPLTS